MAVQLSTAVQNAMCNAAVDHLDSGGSNGTIKIYSGTQPANANSAITGTLLATFTLDLPAFGSASSGVATLSAVPLSTVGLAAGTATHFRAATSASGTAFDGSVTVTAGGGQIELNTTTVSVGVSLEITAGTFTQPAA
ncbi:hypothetical protein DEJ49_33455 [Streptomyces venezuelae]|uniref:Uncharacterized protein n=1 Tax=Streptomyces venezuelae TaxID=54571 RepID=A0A5P2CU32_STRVZ|nr:hypothetical protein [Streptomyces venezuelae]QES45248.1 hypothetical protein DEJ49_33455 [Streptomyces venezuelae]